MQDTLSVMVSLGDFGSYSSDPTRADYACEAYRSMLPRWKMVKDLRGGTIAIRENKETYLPKFDAESDNDYKARVAQTFVNEWYGETLEEHVGLVMSEPIQLEDDVPEIIVQLCEDIDGEGNHVQVFAEDALDKAQHWGHIGLLTEYPSSEFFRDRGDERRANARPYAVLYEAPDILNWEEEVYGGQKMITRLMLREHYTAKKEQFGSVNACRFREVRQEVTYDEFSGRVVALGGVSWILYRQEGSDAPVQYDTGTVTGPRGAPLARIPFRVVYGGQKLGTLHTKPHLMGVAFSNIEETQVQSDYAAIMHKCNVPTPIFINRVGAGDGTTIKMGEGVDIGLGGDAKFMEPTGVALDATYKRLEKIVSRIKNQGATSSADDKQVAMTAAQARIISKTRNAKIRKGARSLQDGLEGLFADFAMFTGTAAKDATKSGGSVTVNQNFTGEELDSTYLTVLLNAYDKQAFPLEALLFALQHGHLPEEFSAEDAALQLVAEQEAKAEADAQMAKDLAKANGGGAVPPKPGAPAVP